ncbi:unnamed protein product [Clavelina lepadiformis]|uniref:Threonine synthase n=1 Tax=Clavelina lepadiformis TaxID=159417 RepID=A0ABP0FZI2_CLALP
MKYVSTRFKVTFGFEEALFCCFTEDGGLLMPETTPKVSLETLKKWKNLTYDEIVKQVVGLFVAEDEVPEDARDKLLDNAFQHFDTKDIVCLKELNDGLNVLELWHGDTLAFKDLAMTCTVQFLNYFLKKRKKHFTAVVVTSGDTGSSAIYGARNLKTIDVIVLYPHNRISKLQELMMTTAGADNIHLYAVDGSSDDIDIAAMKVWTDAGFIKEHNVGTMNSMNWCRIMIQIAHHIYAYLKVAKQIGDPVNIIIPCGGCGNMTSCVLARDMRLPIQPVGVSNKNDSFHKMMKFNERVLSNVSVSLAPAMDIALAQNVERIIWLLTDRSYDIVRHAMEDFLTNKKSKLPDSAYKKMCDVISTSVASDEIIIKAMKRCWEENQYHICPHTATAVAHFYGITEGCFAVREEKNVPSVCLATASAAKFAEAVEKADLPPCHSPKIQALEGIKERYEYVAKDVDWADLIRNKVVSISLRYQKK